MSNTNLQVIIEHFEFIRANVELRKKPATAELIHWALLLQKLNFDTNKLKNIGQLGGTDRNQLLLSYAVLAKTKEDMASLKKLINEVKS